MSDFIYPTSYENTCKGWKLFIKAILDNKISTSKLKRVIQNNDPNGDYEDQGYYVLAQYAMIAALEACSI